MRGRPRAGLLEAGSKAAGAQHCSGRVAVLMRRSRSQRAPRPDLSATNKKGARGMPSLEDNSCVGCLATPTRQDGHLASGLNSQASGYACRTLDCSLAMQRAESNGMTSPLFHRDYHLISFHLQRRRKSIMFEGIGDKFPVTCSSH